MPWKEIKVLKQRESLMEALAQPNSNLSELCREYGISRKTVYKWLKRYQEDPVSGLIDLRTVRSYERFYSPNDVEPILTLKRRHLTWGARKLLAFLKRQQPECQWPSEGTIKALLKREGFVKSRRRRSKCPVSPSDRQRTEAMKPNDVWCTDLKGWFRTEDRSRCEPLTVLDEFSRYLLGVKHVSSRKFPESKKIIEGLFKEHGKPKVVRSDNGSPFGSPGLCSLTPLSVWLITEGVYPEKIRPAHPEENGRQERFHRTLKAETAKPPAKTLSKQDQRFQEFKEEYNHERPHDALGLETPSCYYQSGQYRVSPKFEYPEGVKVVKVNGKGYLRLSSRTIYLSESLINKEVRLEEAGDGEIRIDFQGYHLGVVQESDPHE
jgi:putative transposase